MQNSTKSENRHSADQRLHKGLEDSFPASDPPSVLRAPKSKKDDGMHAARIDRKPPILSGSSEAVVEHEQSRPKR